MAESLQEVWSVVSKYESWLDVRNAITPLMAMPGSKQFDNDSLFLDLEIFPGVFVDDPKWRYPREWGPNPELSVNQNLSINFDVDLGDGSNLLDPKNEELLLAAKRIMYLILFQPFTRPFKLSTYRQYRQTIISILRWFAMNRVRLGITRLDDLNNYELLAECINSLNWKLRQKIPRIYVLLRWWRSKSDTSYRFFVPPPTIEAVNKSADFNPRYIRDDSVDHVQAQWQPLPDTFVAQAGAIWLDYTEKILPKLLLVLADIRDNAKITQRSLRDSTFQVLSDVQWPAVCFPFREPKSLQRLISVANYCQLSVIQLLSLAVGPRWSEVKRMPITSVTTKRLDGQTRYILEARTFKFSQMIHGTEHHWPIATRIGTMLERQTKLVKCINGDAWPYLWTGFTTTLFDGQKPLIQVDHLLKRFAKKYDLIDLLNGGKFHHHRFRKTVARLVVIALNGGPMILKELFGHETLAMTMRYILANEELRDDLRNVADSENRLIAEIFVSNEGTLKGGGATYFREVIRRAREEITVLVPTGKSDQADLSLDDLMEFISSEPEGVQIKQVLPQVIGCIKPLSENGECMKAGGMPDIALCSKSCRWHLQMDNGGKDLARHAIRDALSNLKKAKGSLQKQFWKRIIAAWITDYPDLDAEFDDEPTHVINSYGKRRANPKKN